jgi:hypothetical protein
VQSGSGGYNSGQYFQSPSQQMSRNAHYSQTMMQGNAGEAAQFVDPRTGSCQSPMVVQVSPQNQVFRQNGFRLMPSEQGMLSIGTQKRNAMQSSAPYSGTESTTANTAVQQSRGAAA